MKTRPKKEFKRIIRMLISEARHLYATTATIIMSNLLSIPQMILELSRANVAALSRRRQQQEQEQEQERKRRLCHWILSMANGYR